MADDLYISDGGEVLRPKREIAWTKPLIVVLTLATVFVLAIGIGAGIVLFSQRTTVTPPAPAPAENQPIATPAARISPRFASDSAILKLQGDVQTWVSEVDGLDLIEPQLALPAIDPDIKVELR